MRRIVTVIVFALVPLALQGQQAPNGAGQSHLPQQAKPATSADVAAERIENVDVLKAQLRQYHDCTCICGCYTKDIDGQADRAIAFLRKRAAQRHVNEKLALVLDIDETTL